MSDDKKINYGTVEIPDSNFEPETVMILKSIYDKKVKLLKAAEAEIERLKTERDLAQGLADSRPSAELFANTLKTLREELTRERKVTKVLEEALEDYANRMGIGDTARAVLALVKEMRK